MLWVAAVGFGWLVEPVVAQTATPQYATVGDPDP